MDAGTKDGRELATKYGINGYPTLLVVDANGDEVDRIVGYRKPEPFVKEIERIRRGEGTLPALRKKVAENPDDLATALEYAKKLAASKPDEGIAAMEDVEKKAHGKDKAIEAKALLAQVGVHQRARRIENVVAIGERLVNEFGDQEAALAAAQQLLFWRLRPSSGSDEPDAESALAYARELRQKLSGKSLGAQGEGLVLELLSASAGKAVERMAEAAGDDAQALNEAAWAAFQLKVSLKPAEAWARKAVEKSDRDPAILDTLASILFEKGKADEAIALEEEAAGKVSDPRMKAEFAENIAKWKAVRDLRKAGGGKASLPGFARNGGDEDGEDEDGEDEDGEGPEDDESHEGAAKPAEKGEPQKPAAK